MKIECLSGCFSCVWVRESESASVHTHPHILHNYTFLHITPLHNRNLWMGKRMVGWSPVSISAAEHAHCLGGLEPLSKYATTHDITKHRLPAALTLCLSHEKFSIHFTPLKWIYMSACVCLCGCACICVCFRACAVCLSDNFFFS